MSWLNQLPLDLAADGRRLEANFSTAEWNDPEIVALECFKLVQRRHDPDIKARGGDC